MAAAKGAAKQPAKPPTAEAVQTPLGVLEYVLTRKRVRNLNVRVRPGGAIAASAPARMPKAEIERFIVQKAAWLFKTRAALLSRPPAAPCLYTKQQCLALFGPISDAIFPLFASLLGGQKPVLKVRDMKSRWGSCNPKTRTITLNMRLAEKPPALQEYVILHEYVHFLHPDHQRGFHAEMARLMPDYKARRKLLRG